MLWGFDAQTDHNFEIVIADDGSREDTRQLIERFARATDRPIQHIWQEDDGFQKCRILNKAIVAARGDYLILTDGDCIPRKDFVRFIVPMLSLGVFERRLFQAADEH